MLGWRLRLGLSAVIALAHFGCGAEADPPEPSPELEVFDTRLIGEPAPAEPESGTEVVLLDPGAEPRRKLRYRRAPDLEQRVVVESSMVQRFEQDGNPLRKLRTPTTRVEVVLRAQPGDGARAQRFDVEFVEAQALDYSRIWLAGGEDALTTVESLLDESMEVEIGGRGILGPELFEAGWGADGTVEGTGRATLMGTLAGVLQTALPEEAVGVGARWRVSTPQPSNQLPFGDARQVFELVAMDGDRLELAEEGTFDIDDGSIPAQPNMEATSSGSGHRIIDLGSVAPSLYESTATMSFSWDLRDGQDVRRIHMTIVMELEGVGS